MSLVSMSKLLSWGMKWRLEEEGAVGWMSKRREHDFLSRREQKTKTLTDIKYLSLTVFC